eukprot:4638617-Prymnesium_polylepis.1
MQRLPLLAGRRKGDVPQTAARRHTLRLRVLKLARRGSMPRRRRRSRCLALLLPRADLPHGHELAKGRLHQPRRMLHAQDDHSWSTGVHSGGTVLCGVVRHEQ